MREGKMFFPGVLYEISHLWNFGISKSGVERNRAFENILRWINAYYISRGYVEIRYAK